MSIRKLSVQLQPCGSAESLTVLQARLDFKKSFFFYCYLSILSTDNTVRGSVAIKCACALLFSLSTTDLRHITRVSQPVSVCLSCVHLVT